MPTAILYRVLKFMYTKQCDVKEQELVQLLSVVKELRANGLLYKKVSDTNIAMEHGVSEVQSNEEVKNISRKR